MAGNIDRITGRIKQAAGDLMDDSKLRESGVKDEQKAQAKEDLARAQREADAKAQEVANLERDGSREHGSGPSASGGAVGGEGDAARTPNP
ncbi:MAG: hypothetical protein M3Z27_08900 [Actinomycetota bacterium]|nr:hypothetical protein [Actinomycetota bacterium]